MSRFCAIVLILSLIATASKVSAAEPLADIEGDVPKELGVSISRVLGEVEAAPRSMSQARRRGAKAKASALSVLRSEGYYGAEVSVLIPRALDAQIKASASRQPRLTITPGLQFRFKNMAINYDGQALDQAKALAKALSAALPIKDGDPALALSVVRAEAAIVTALRQAGYPEAIALKRKAVVDHDSKTLSVTFNIAPGDKTRFGEIRLTRDTKVSESWIKIVSPAKPGALADVRQLDALSSRLISTQAFAGVVSSLSDDPKPNADGTVTRDIVLNIDTGKKNTVSAEIGVSTTDGTGVDVVYTRRNLRRRGETLKLTSTAKTNLLSLGADYHIPYAWSVHRALDLGVQIAREDTEAFSGERVTTKALMSREVNERLKFSAGIGLEVSQFEEDDQNIRAYLVEGLGRVYYDARNSIVDPSKGYLLDVNATPTYNFGQSDGLFTTIETAASAYQRLSDSLVFAGRAKSGTILGASTDSVPLNRRYYGGGGGSVRGYGYQTISPSDIDGDLIGGRSLAEAGAELRYRGKSAFGFVAFVDAGSVSSTDLPNFDEVLVGAGLGLRYYTSFAPIRADIAIPLNKREGDNAFQIYISIGQAF